MPKRFVSAKKEGRKIILTTSTDYFYIFDFAERTITSKKGVLKSYPLSKDDSADEELTDGEKLLINICKNIRFPSADVWALRKYEKIETFLSSLDICPASWGELPSENPKGYIKWLRENNLKISQQTLTDFKEIESLLKLPKDIILKYNQLKSTELVIPQGLKYLTKNPEKIPVLYSMLKNTHKNFEPQKFLCENITFLFRHVSFADKWDRNRSIGFNYELVNNLVEAERYKELTINQERFKALEEVEHDNWQIIVPTTINQLIEEGKQQNNCVGRLYPKYIIEGNTLVYFIRKKNSPDKSWHTCSARLRGAIYSNQVLLKNNHLGKKEVKDWVESVVDKKIEEIYAKFLEK